MSGKKGTATPAMRKAAAERMRKYNESRMPAEVPKGYEHVYRLARKHRYSRAEAVRLAKREAAHT